MNSHYATILIDRVPAAGAFYAPDAQTRQAKFDEAALVQNARRAQEGAFEELWRAHASREE